MTDAPRVPIGTRFRMTRTEEIKERGVVLSRFRSGEAYAVTAQNAAQVSAWLEASIARIDLGGGVARPAPGGNGGNAAAAPGRVTGTVES